MVIGVDHERFCCFAAAHSAGERRNRITRKGGSVIELILEDKFSGRRICEAIRRVFDEHGKFLLQVGERRHGEFHGTLHFEFVAFPDFQVARRPQPEAVAEKLLDFKQRECDEKFFHGIAEAEAPDERKVEVEERRDFPGEFLAVERDVAEAFSGGFTFITLCCTNAVVFHTATRGNGNVLGFDEACERAGQPDYSCNLFQKDAVPAASSGRISAVREPEGSD
jgi:hypothetical protein